jgi:hypothetical protein
MLVSAEGLNFTRAVFGTSREEVGMDRYHELFARHHGDRILDAPELPPVDPLR